MKNMRRGSGLVLGLLWLLMADLASAGDYEIIVGKGVELCEACLQNLLRQSAEEAACDRRYAPDLGFGQPEWETLALQGHVELYKRMSNLVRSGKEDLPKPDLGNPSERDEFIRVEEITRGALSAVHIDIDNDGQLDRVLKYQSGNCRRNFHGYNIFYQSALVVVVGDHRAIDYPKTDLLVQHFPDASKFLDMYRIGMPHYQMYQVFTYKGTVYFDRWDRVGQELDPITRKAIGPDRNTVSIYEVRQGQARRTCQIRLFPPDSVPHN